MDTLILALALLVTTGPMWLTSWADAIRRARASWSADPIVIPAPRPLLTELADADPDATHVSRPDFDLETAELAGLRWA